MPIVRDFRKYSFQASRIDRCAKNVGGKLYWKLYALENTVRIVINSVLLLQIGQQWWTTAVAPPVRTEAQRRRNRAAARPQHASPGVHDIYLIGLFELIEILRANSHLFLPIIPETNQWVVTLEGIRPSRNLVGHMNFPNAYDRGAIDVAHRQLPNLVARLSGQNIPIAIP
jgi:hypothetical protein